MLDTLKQPSPLFTHSPTTKHLRLFIEVPFVVMTRQSIRGYSEYTTVNNKVTLIEHSLLDKKGDYNIQSLCLNHFTINIYVVKEERYI